MHRDPNIRQALTNYIVKHDNSYTEAKLAGLTILDLIVLKTEIELRQMKSRTVIP